MLWSSGLPQSPALPASCILPQAGLGVGHYTKQKGRFKAQVDTRVPFTSVCLSFMVKPQFTTVHKPSAESTSSIPTLTTVLLITNLCFISDLFCPTIVFSSSQMASSLPMPSSHKYMPPSQKSSLPFPVHSFKVLFFFKWSHLFS